MSPARSVTSIPFTMKTSNLPSLFCLLALMVSGGPLLAHPVPDSPLWLTYLGGDGPGKGKNIVLIAAEQEYRNEQSMPMMARILSQHHGSTARFFSP